MLNKRKDYLRWMGWGAKQSIIIIMVVIVSQAICLISNVQFSFQSFAFCKVQLMDW